jgi:hypothetical protein
MNLLKTEHEKTMDAIWQASIDGLRQENLTLLEKVSSLESRVAELENALRWVEQNFGTYELGTDMEETIHVLLTQAQRD